MLCCVCVHVERGGSRGGGAVIACTCEWDLIVWRIRTHLEPNRYNAYIYIQCMKRSQLFGSFGVVYETCHLRSCVCTHVKQNPNPDICSVNVEATQIQYIYIYVYIYILGYIYIYICGTIYLNCGSWGFWL